MMKPSVLIIPFFSQFLNFLLFAVNLFFDNWTISITTEQTPCAISSQIRADALASGCC